MRASVITNCTNRKRLPPNGVALARHLPDGPASDIAREWITRLSAAPQRLPAEQLYCGRGFSEALRASRTLDGAFFVASAGLGLVASATPIPSYGATAAPGTADTLQRRADQFQLQDWWQAIKEISPFSANLVLGATDLVLVALSRPYLAMLSRQLEEWAASAPAKLRLFLRLSADEAPRALKKSVMPYDARLDDPQGPMPGTQGDFAQRALHHFVRQILPTAPAGSPQEHAALVRRSLADLRAPGRLNRDKRTDDEIRELIERHWGEVGGSSSRMLRKLRDDLGVACEQGRFKGLFHQVAGAREASLLQ